MSQKLFTPLEQQVLGPHLKHPNPHGQYALDSETVTEEEVNALLAAMEARLQAEIDGISGGSGPSPSNGTPATEAVADVGSAGTAATYSRGDHRHPMPGLATNAAAGFMSAADKNYLDTLVGLPFPAGSESAPSLLNEEDGDTGFWWDDLTDGADPGFGYSVGGIQRIAFLGGTTQFFNKIFVKGAMEFDNANSIIFGTSTGTLFGTGTNQKFAFWNAIPISQPSGADEVAVATTGATNVGPYGFTTAAQANAIVTLVNALRQVLVDLGLWKGAA